MFFYTSICLGIAIIIIKSIICLQYFSHKYMSLYKNIYFNIYLKCKNRLNINNLDYENKTMLKKYLKQSIEEYDKLKEDIQLIQGNNFNEEKFNSFFSIYHNKLFINPQTKIHLKYPSCFYYNLKYDYLNIDSPKLVLNSDTKNYIKIIGKFLEIYMTSDINIDKIPELIYPDHFASEEKFKNNLIYICYLGNNIIKTINNKKNVENNHMIFFNSTIIHIYKKLHEKPISDHEYPYMYDWKIYIKYYTLVLCQKLYIDYTILGIIDKKYINEILIYIPNLSCSKNIIRSGLIAHIINIRFIIAMIFFYKNEHVSIHFFLLRINKNIDIFFNDLAKSNDLIFFTDGGISENNIINYSHMFKLIYPQLLYYMLYGDYFEKNINIIFRSIFKILYFYTKKVNPCLLYDHDNINRLYIDLIKFYNNINYLKILQDNYYIKKIKSELEFNTIEETVEFLESTYILSAKYKYWNIQIKLHSNYVYGILDNVKQTDLVKHTWLSKIILFKEINMERFLNDGIYPGMIFFKTEEYNKSSFCDPDAIKEPKKLYTLTKVLHGYKIFENLYFISFCKVYSQELHLTFNELILVTPSGIIVGYFNLIKLLNDKLYLCYNSPIYDNKIDTGILFKDTLIDIKNEQSSFYTNFYSDVLYYNMFYKTIIKLQKIVFEGLDIYIKLKIDNKIFKINISNNEIIEVSVF